MSQAALFHESLSDALREVVHALGGAKVAGARLRPELPADQAGRWLADCLNADRREHLGPDQVVWLLREGRASGVHAGMAFLAQACGYAPPVAVEPESELLRMQREFIEASKRIEALGMQLQSMSTRVVNHG